MIGLKIGGIIVAAFIAGAFVASPELRAYASTIANDVICSGCVGTSDLAGNAVTSAKIKNGEVKTADIANGSVTNAKLAANSVDSSKIVNNGVSGDDILDNTIEDVDLAPNSVGPLALMTDSVQAAEIQANSVGASEIEGVTVLGFGVCGIDPPDIGGTDEGGAKGRLVVTTLCALPAGATRVIAYPYTTQLAPGLVPCGSIVSGGGNLWVCLQNVFDTTNVDDINRQWSWIAFSDG